VVVLFNLKRILKNKLNIFFMIVLPLMMILLTIAVSMGKSNLKIGIIDNDNTKWTSTVRSILKDKGEIVPLDESEIKERLMYGLLDYIIVIDKGTTQKLINGEDIKIKTYYIEGNSLYIPIENALDMFFDTSKRIAKISNNNERFYYLLNEYLSGNIKIKISNDEKPSTFKKDKLIAAIGFSVMSMLMLAFSSTQTMLIDKVKKVNLRIFVSPIKYKTYIFQSIISWLIVVGVQAILVSLFFRIFYSSEVNKIYFKLLLIILSFSWTAVSLGVLIVNLSKDLRQVGIFSPLINTPLCMLGGCFWDLSFMPKYLQNLANFLPTTWAMKASNSLIYNQTNAVPYKEIIIILLFGVFFMLLAFKRRKNPIS